MPRVVDHEGRRHELAEAAWRAIVKYGLDGTTTRLDILLEALRISHDGIDKRIRDAVDDKGRFDALRTFCVELLPIRERISR